MDLKQRLRADLTTAMKDRDELRTATLRMALAAVANAEVAGKAARTLADDEVQRVLSSEAKRRREAAEAFDAGARPELASRERAEGMVLEGYLPTPLADAELTVLVADAINSVGASSPGDLGRVMRVAAGTVAGRADGGRVAAEVRRQLVLVERESSATSSK